MEPICYQVYFGNKYYFITNTLSAELEELAHKAGTILVNHPDGHTIKKTIQDIALAGTRAVIILTNEAHFYWDAFRHQFTCISAGGGVVQNEKEELLMIYRLGMWDLPKGKWDEGESIEDCALREVTEETGLKQITLHKLLTQTYHTYILDGNPILKTTWWFNMEAKSEQPMTPQIEEDISIAKWIPPAEYTLLKEKTYPSIRQVLHLLHAE